MIENCTINAPEIRIQQAAQDAELARRIQSDQKLRKKLKSRDIKHLLPEDKNDNDAATKKRREMTTTRRNEK